MVVLLVERVSPSLRGFLTRWMLEARAGVFIGTLSATVRDKLWDMTCEAVKSGAVVMIHPAENEQGFAIRSFGDRDREVVDYEGLLLFRRLPKDDPKSAQRRATEADDLAESESV